MLLPVSSLSAPLAARSATSPAKLVGRRRDEQGRWQSHEKQHAETDFPGTTPAARVARSICKDNGSRSGSYCRAIAVPNPFYGGGTCSKGLWVVLYAPFRAGGLCTVGCRGTVSSPPAGFSRSFRALPTSIIPCGHRMRSVHRVPNGASGCEPGVKHGSGTELLAH
eukprot:scaffold1629_cov369-Prasinococcus_capsulatus_cf.AAC.22